MKNIILPIFKFLNFMKVKSNSSLKSNIISFIIISIIIYIIYSVLSFDIGLLSLIVSFLISFFLTNFFLIKFEFASLKNISLEWVACVANAIQRFLNNNILFITLAILLVYTLNLFNLLPISIIHCSTDESILPSHSSSGGAEIACSEKLGGALGGEGSKDFVKITNETDCNNPDKDIKVEYYNFKIRKSLIDEGFKIVYDASKLALENIVPNLGVGAAAGSAVFAAVKHSAGMGFLPRLAVVGATAFVTAAGTKLGLGIGGVISKI